ncbi:PilN domain-containing protein [Candidatus Manganitrophus noduliformans]|nr:PilN domain-containing protein [Candidatus Manganitrophus noduliformans]
MMKEHINLFQPDLLEGAAQARTPRKKQWAVASAGIFLVLFILFYIQEEKKQILLKREVDAILQQRQQLEQQMAALAPGTLSRGEGALTEEAILKERIAWSRVLVEVSRVVPEGVWITGFENNAGEGVRFDGFAVSYQKVTDLLSSLEASRMFQDVLLDFSRQNTERKVDFSINTRLKKVDPEVQLGMR